MMDINEILKHLPTVIRFVSRSHRRNTGTGENRRDQNVSINESFFQGHFPHHPVMPGVLIMRGDGAGRLGLAHCARGGNDENKVFVLTGR